MNPNEEKTTGECERLETAGTAYNPHTFSMEVNTNGIYIPIFGAGNTVREAKEAVLADLREKIEATLVALEDLRAIARQLESEL